jgi:hypothetical protein
MFNLFLILYLLLLLFFFGGFTVVIYHLWVYRMNKIFSIFSILIFSLGFFAILAFNVMFASQIDWSQYSFIF